jgi:tetratricopeptide (TPR) repeat protein
MNFLRFIIISVFFLNHFCGAKFYELPKPVHDEKPLLVVLIMVKNEAPSIEATLKPFLDAGHQQYLILDTGSTDDTIAIIYKLFKKYNIKHGHIAEKPFVNFGESRSYAIRQAEKIFPNAVFFLMIDAEWYLNNVQGLLKFCEEQKDSQFDAFFIYKYFKPLRVKEYIDWLFRAHKNIYFLGLVHEHISVKKRSSIRVPDDVFICHDPSKYGDEKSNNRWRKDVEILLKECEKNPNGLRAMFYLGQSYACLKNNKQALLWYGKRCTNVRHDEENYQAHYRMAMIYEALKDFKQAILYYLKAYDIMQSRAEPLIRASQLYLNTEEYFLAFWLAMQAKMINLSGKDIMFIEQHLYDFVRYNILSTCAWHIGEYESGKLATLQSLRHRPETRNSVNNALMFDNAINHRSCNALDRSKWCDWCNGKLWMSRAPWLNFACLSNASYRSNRCNSSTDISWRNWF